MTGQPIRVAFPPIGGNIWAGGQNYLRNLVSALRQFDAARVQPVLFADAGYSPATVCEIIAAGAEVVRDERFARERQLRRAVSALTTGSDAMAAAVYRTANIDMAFENVTYHGWRFPLPVLTWFPDMQHREMPQMFSKLGWWRRDVAFRLAIGKGRHVLLSSESARADLLRAYPDCRAQLHIVPFAVPEPDPIARSDVAAAQIELELPRKWFFLPNQFWQHKNHGLVVEALAIATTKHPEIVVVCTGSTQDPRNPNAFTMLMTRVASAGLKNNFRSLGQVPFSRVQALMQGAIALINPSKFEGWSTTVEEAKALGLPMLLSDIAVHREQADGIANFFAIDDYEELARQLTGLWIAPPRRRSTDDGAARKSFANRFADVTEIVVGRR